jgi:tellurite methyltransferase
LNPGNLATRSHSEYVEGKGLIDMICGPSSSRSARMIDVERPPWSPWGREYVKTPTHFIWGTRPSELAREATALAGRRARVLDLGCGEGRDTVFLAEQGHDVVGVDLSIAGLRKAQRLAEARGVRVPWVCAELPDLPVRGPFDLVYSCGSIHYVARDARRELFVRLRDFTRRGGHHAHVVFTERCVYREKSEVVHYFTSDELRDAYRGWSILRDEEGLIPCAQDGVHHVHSVETILAQRP